MKRWPIAPTLVVLAATAFGGGVMVALATSHDERDPAPPAASRDVPGVVAIGRPITPYPAGDPATGQIELRIADPTGGAPLAVLFHRSQRVRQGRTIREQCLEGGRERQLRRYPVREGGSCRPSTAPEPWSISITASAGGPVIVNGWTSPRVKRLTAAGPGGTFVLPRSEHGAFAVAYAATTRGRMVLSATLTDGSRRFFRSQIPPSRRPDGAVTAADPGGLPTWFTAAHKRTDGARRGQTCLQVQQDDALHETAPGRRGGHFLAPVCGDLSRAPVFARTVQLTPSRRPSTFGPTRFAPRRTIIAGAVSDDVKSVAVSSPAGRRQLPLADAGRAFLAVFPAATRPAELTLEVTFDNGQVKRFPNPVAVNRATTKNPTPRLHGPVSLRQDPAAPRRVILTARLTAPVTKRFEITFLGREIRMRRTGGPNSSPVYRGIYDGTRGAQRPITRGRLYPFSVLVCNDICFRPGSHGTIPARATYARLR
ncbi:MAG: hypothetical protein Q8K79_08825 [Solirubrobacteraceae bacterium]|nr:hypothetical protein [Solirubrobacteraceae bacterium]